jgi:CubicO group peptidase (beta-lactamase class C family)
MRRFVTTGILVATLLIGLPTRADSALAGSPYFTSGSQVNRYLTMKHFRGYALLIRHGKVLLSKGYGMADSRHHIPNTIHTRWPMFSIEGFMMAMVVLKLQEQRQLSVHDKVCRYLESCPISWAPITLQHLIIGTSGITLGAATSGVFFSRGTFARTVQQCKSTPLTGTPGTLLDDNLCNRALLSVIIAKVVKQPFGTVLRQMIFRPAGMTESSVVTNTMHGSALGYKFGRPAPRIHPTYPQVYSSVGDVLRLDRALLAGKIISKTSRVSMFTPYINDNPGGNPVYRGYGQTYVVKAHRFFGIADNSVSPVNTEKIVFQEGGPDGAGFRTDNWLSPHDGTTAIWMTNDDGFVTNRDVNIFVARCAKLLWSR